MYNLQYRQLTENDYHNFLVKWWKDNRFTPPPIDFLPNNGKDGIVVFDVDTNTNIAAGFVYITNSEVAWIEFIVSNFEVKNKELRKQAIEFLIKQLTITTGKKYHFSSIKNPNLIKHFVNSGFIIGTQNTTELISVTK
jgi:hypothetical protein